MNKYYRMLDSILQNGRDQQSRKGSSRYLLNQVMALTPADLHNIFESYGIARRKLRSNGFAALEINEQLGIETATLFTQRGLVSTIRKDFRNRDRMIIASKQQ